MTNASHGVRELRVGQEVKFLDPKIADTCLARRSCKLHGMACGTTCPWYIDLRYQMEMAGIPRRHAKWSVGTLPADSENLAVLRKYAETVVDRISDGQGLYLYGTVGNGKTTAACAITISYLIAKTYRDISQGRSSRQLVQFVNVPDLLAEIKRGFDNDGARQSTDNILDSLSRVSLVVMDDIGAERPSEWVRERLLTVVGKRYDDELATFFTSNYTLGALRESLDGRLTSRIAGMTKEIKFTGKDRRQQQ